jgi:hypothetical protein
VPGDGDTATVNHAVTVDQNTVVGDNPASNTVVLTVAAPLTIGNNGTDFFTLDVEGSINYANSRIEALGNFANGRLRLANVPDGVVYDHNISTASNQGQSRLTIEGDPAAPFTLDSTPSGTTGIGTIDDGGFIGGGQVQVDNANVALGGASNDIEFWPRDISGWVYRWHNCTFTACGQLDNAVSLTAASHFTLSFCRWRTTAASTCTDILGGTTLTTGTRTINHCDFDKTFQFFSALSITLDHNIYRGGVTFTMQSASSAVPLTNCILVKPSQSGSNLIGGFTGGYICGTYTGSNQHVFNQLCTAALSITDNVFDLDSGSTTGDLILLPTGSTATRLITITGNVVLPRRTNANLACGIFISSQAPTSGLTVVIEHNTVPSVGNGGDSGALLRVGETQTGYAGMFPSVQSNLVYAPGTATEGTVIETTGTPADDIITDADFNCGWALGDDSAFSDNYMPADTKFANTPGVNDVNVNPNFVAAPGVRNITAWDTERGSGTGTVTAALDHIADGGTTAFETRYDDLYDWTRGGYGVQESTLEDAGHDSVTIGAMEFVPAAGGQGPLIGGLRNHLVRAV